MDLGTGIEVRFVWELLCSVSEQRLLSSPLPSSLWPLSHHAPSQEPSFLVPVTGHSAEASPHTAPSARNACLEDHMKELTPLKLSKPTCLL